MSDHLGELSLGRKRKLKRPNLADAIDTPPKKLRKTTSADGTTPEDTQRAKGLHSLMIETGDTTKQASSLSCVRKKDPIRPIDDQKGIFPTVLPNFRQSSLAQQKRGLRASSSLCKRCKKIDLDKLLSTKYKTRGGLPAGGLSNVSTWEVDTCPLCNLFRSTLLPNLPDDHMKIALQAYSSKRINYMGWSSVDTNMLQIFAGYSQFSGRYIVSQPSGIKGPVQMIREKIEQYQTVKSWINLCQVMHTKVCMIKDPSTVKYQKLIDCRTRTLVPAEDHPYVALSYVWGLIPKICAVEVIDESGKLPTKLPRTIEDAITVTQKLDFRYLWVDRYCIDQEEGEEKAYQVGKMNLIYMNAELIIIGAAGSDPNYGLPGVGHQKRKSRNLTTCARIGKHFLITTADTPTWPISRSKWATRGWTFQEGLLSRRRLVFTEEQMYFECHGMYCCESLKFPHEYMHRKDKEGFKKKYCVGTLVGAFPKGIGRTNLEIVRRIEEYTKRTLSNSDDILNGMLGIFNAFESSNMKVKHYLGIPILPPMTKAPYRGDISKPVQGWTPAMGFFVGLCWDLEKSAERRSGFPSWSWTGWQSTVSWSVGSRPTFSSFQWPAMTVDPNVELSVECTNGQILSWESFQKSKNEATMPLQMSNIIRITAWTIQFPIVSRNRRRDRYEYITWLNLEDGGILDWEFGSKNFLLEPFQSCTGIFLDQPSEENDDNAIIMILTPKGEVYERIGLAQISRYKRFDKNGEEVATEVYDESGYHIYGLRLNPPTLSKSWKEVRIG